MGSMQVLFEEGDNQLSWDPSIPEEVRAARSTFEQYVKKGYIACRLDKGGSRGTLIEKFDPEAEEILLLAMLEGG